MDNFCFKYIPEAELSKIVKDVKRERRKKNEEKEWEEYLVSQKLKFSEKRFKQKLLLSGLRNSVCCYGDSEIHPCSKVLFAPNGCPSIDTVGSVEDEKVCKILRHNCDSEMLCINLEKVNKLDKLRIFDSFDQRGTAPTSDCSHIYQHHDHFHHKNNHLNDGHLHHKYLQIEEKSRCQNCKNLKNPQFHHCMVAALNDNDKTLGNGDGGGMCNVLTKQFSAIDDSTFQNKLISNCQRSSSCIDLRTNGVAENHSKVQEVLINDGNKNPCDINNASELDALIPSVSYTSFQVEKSVHTENPDVGTYDPNNRLLSIECTLKSSRSSTMTVSDRKGKPITDTYVCSSLGNSVDAHSVMDSAFELCDAGKFYNHDKLSKMLPAIQEENSLMFMNEIETCDCPVDIGTDSKISESPSYKPIYNCHITGSVCENNSRLDKNQHPQPNLLDVIMDLNEIEYTK